MLTQIQKFIDTTSFTNALKVTIAAVIPVVIFTYFGMFNIGFVLALGAIFVYPSDIASSLNQKIYGIVLTAILTSIITLIVNIFFPYKVLFYLIITLLIFSISIVSVYGQRASMLSFSCLVALALAFSNTASGWPMFFHALLIFAGGIFYLLVSLVFHYLKPNRYLELQVQECMKLTAKYLKLRGDLWSINADRKAITEKQLHLQVELNIIHQNIREVLIPNHSINGSSAANRKMLIVFICLVEILELALSTAFDHEKLHDKFDDHPKVLATYQNLAYHLASSLKSFSKNIKKRKTQPDKPSLWEDINALQIVITQYEKALGKQQAVEGVFMLTTMLQYADKQVDKIKTIEHAFTRDYNTLEYKGLDKDIEKFLTPQHYPWTTLIENLSFSSSIFRHSLRITVTLIIGLTLGSYFPFQNAYWILLTIIVIMKPGYGLTKERTFQRIIGTILGGIIAFGILYFIKDNFIISMFCIICMLLGFAFSQTNYKIGATFVTMYVVFIYGILTPNVNELVQYRIVDTLVGALLAAVANYFLWPTWEFLSAPATIKKAVLANQNYLKEISIYYNTKGTLSTSYKLARKNAFIEIGNLMACYQRMVQEPKTKQLHLEQVYELAVLNHSLLSSIASLGTYIQSHKTTAASESFNVVVNTGIQNLQNAIETLNGNNAANQSASVNELKLRFTELKNIQQREISIHKSSTETDFDSVMQEAQLVIEQLMWLINLSEKIVQTTQTLKSIS